MRTSFEIDENLFYEVKKMSLRSKKSVGAIIEDALRVMVIKNKKPQLKEKITLVTCGEGGLNHGIDLDDNKSLLDIMGD